VLQAEGESQSQIEASLEAVLFTEILIVSPLVINYDKRIYQMEDNLPFFQKDDLVLVWIERKNDIYFLPDGSFKFNKYGIGGFVRLDTINDKVVNELMAIIKNRKSSQETPI
jgi:hypothetical protein